MVTQTVVLCYIFIVLYFLGRTVRYALGKANVVATEDKIPIDITVILGLLLLHIFLSYVSIWAPVNGRIHLLTLLLTVPGIISLGVALRSSKSRWALNLANPSTLTNILLIPSIFFLLPIFFNSLNPLNHYDTGLYYIQNIKWIEQYSVIKGLGNLHGRFAFNSHFLVDSAFFSFRDLNLSYNDQAVVFYSVNTALFLMLQVRLILLIRKYFLQQDSVKLAFYLFILYFSYKVVGNLISNPSPDIISVTLIVYTVTVFLEEFKFRSNLFTLLLLASLASSLITIKLSILFLFLLPIYSCYKWKWKGILIVLIIGLLTVTPFIVRNVIQSGYLIYPYPELDIFNYDWEVAENFAKSEKDWIKSFAIDPKSKPSEVSKLGIGDWISPWFERQNEKVRWMILLVLLSPLILLFRKKGEFKGLTEFKILSLVLFMNLLFWFFTAPNPRFVWGILAVSSSISLGFLTYYIKNERAKQVALYLVFLYFAFFETDSSRRKFGNALNNYPIYPYQVPEQTLKEVETANFTVKIPTKGDRCFDSPLPCTTPHFNKDVKMRGKTFAEGFKVE